MTRISAEEIAELRAKCEVCDIDPARDAHPWKLTADPGIGDADVPWDGRTDVQHGFIVDARNRSIAVEFDWNSAQDEARIIVAAVNALPRLLDRIEELEAWRDSAKRMPFQAWVEARKP